MNAQDLSVYEYRLPFPLEAVRCVGWLSTQHPCEMGAPASGLIEKLEAVIGHRSEDFDAHVNVVRGIHPCNFCDREIEFFPGAKRAFLGMSEIWIRSQSGWFASPSLVLHYITDHGYLPPMVFVQAVMELRTEDRFIGQEVYDRMVSERMASVRAGSK